MLFPLAYFGTGDFLILPFGGYSNSLLGIDHLLLITPLYLRTKFVRGSPADPDVSDIYVRITGPGGAVSYVARRFKTGDAFSRLSFKDASREGSFLPPDVRDRKLCSSTHIIRSDDAPELQKWRGRTLEVTIYGRKISAIYCAVLGSEIYVAPPQSP